jgi:hypothetical protein
MTLRLVVGVTFASFTTGQLLLAPIILDANDTGSGKGGIYWTPTGGAADYLVSAEPYSFAESLPGGSLTQNGGVC